MESQQLNHSESQSISLLYWANQESQEHNCFQTFRMIFEEWYLCTNIWKWMSDKENIIMSASLFSGLPCQICLNPVYLKYSKLTWTCIVKFLVDFLGHQLKELGKSIKSSKTNSRHCIWRLTWRNMNTHCIGQSLLLNAGVWLGPVTLAVGALLLMQVGGSWTWEGPVVLLHVYRIRRNRRMALCIAGIVGSRRSIDIASDFQEREIHSVSCSLLPWCAACIWMHQLAALWEFGGVALLCSFHHCVISNTHEPVVR